MNNAVFLDRDGTIIYEPFILNLHKLGINNPIDYLNKREYDHYKFMKGTSDFAFLPNSLLAMRKLANTEYKIIVVTNQRGVNEGYITRQDLKEQNALLFSVTKEGGRIDKIYYCPHRFDERCSCRKPLIGMLEKAVEDFDIDLKKSWVIGDATSDIQLGKNAGCKIILVRTGLAGNDRRYNAEPDYEVKDLLEAAGLIINFTGRGG